MDVRRKKCGWRKTISMIGGHSACKEVGFTRRALFIKEADRGSEAAIGWYFWMVSKLKNDLCACWFYKNQ